MTTRSSEPHEPFEVLWRNVEPKFRRSLERFGVSPDGSDDMTQDVLQRIADQLRINPDKVPTTERRLLRLAEVTARNLVLNRMQQALNQPPEVSLGTQALSRTDQVESIIDREAIFQAFATLDDDDREIVALILRGGPYTSTQRSMISRARERLRESLSHLLTAGGLSLAALRNRLASLRDRIEAVSHAPLLASTAFVSIGLSVGLLAGPSTAAGPGASPKQVPTTAGNQVADQRASSPSPAALREQAVRPVTPASPDKANRPSAAVPVRANVTVSSSEDATAGSLVIGTPVGGTTNWNGAELSCQSTVRRAVCDGAAAVTGLMAPPGS